MLYLLYQYSPLCLELLHGSSLISITPGQDVRRTCSIKTQYLLPCRHYRLPFARANVLILREMVHPQWWHDVVPFVAAWESGLGLTESKCNPAVIDSLLLFTGLNNGQVAVISTVPSVRDHCGRERTAMTAK